jgi:signal transduction histidine kinase
MQDIEVCNRINDMIELFLPNAKKKEIKLTPDCIENMMIKSDHNIFTLVLQNLISNSIKFTSENGTILIKAYFEEKYAIVEINDNGIGMKPEKIQSILNAEAGISSLGTDGEGGTGIGLSLSRELISKINGKLEISSNYGVGTSAKVYFPLENR